MATLPPRIASSSYASFAFLFLNGDKESAAGLVGIPGSFASRWPAAVPAPPVSGEELVGNGAVRAPVTP
jgi:hypothetical protein